MAQLHAAITQMASENDWTKNCDKAESLVRAAASQGAGLVLLQELFDGDYFCIEQHAEFLNRAEEIDRHPTVKRFAALAKELGVVLPVSVFERAGNAHYNTTVIVDADGRQLGIYRKSHIPDGRGYQEKFYFSPGDTGFKVWDTAVGKIGLGICWEQNAMRGHAAANIMPLMASNRVGKETAPNGRADVFYGRSFITDHQGEKVQEMDRTEEGVRVASFDLDQVRELRRSWGVFRDRRPELYGALMTLDGKTKSAAV
jgi:N-carbamoylputrescine amidase